MPFGNRRKKYFRTRQQLINFIKKIPNAIAGRANRRTTADRRIYNSFWSAVLLSLFTDLHQAYEDKSAGGRDELGDLWEDLSPWTKAYKRSKRGRLTQNQRRKYKNPSTVGLLTPTQYKNWKKTFLTVYRREIRKSRKDSSSDMTDSRAKAKAASFAWAEAKKAGGETLLEVLGGQAYPIMKVTGNLMRSFKPGHIKNRHYVKGDRSQVVKYGNGYVEIGTNIPYANFASRVIPVKGNTYTAFKREFLPDNLGLWYDRAITKGRDAVMAELDLLIQENKHLE
jgi:hypothetical protein